MAVLKRDEFIGKIANATHWWVAERNFNDMGHGDLNGVMPLLFKTFKAIHLIYREMGSSWTRLKRYEKWHLGGKNGLDIKIPHFISDRKYLMFRSLLSLVGDIYNLLTTLKRHDLCELNEPIKNLYEEVQKYRPARNFYTHMNERLCKYDNGIRIHGVEGPLMGANGAEYKDGSAGNIHASIMGNTFYFSERENPSPTKEHDKAIKGVLKEKRISNEEVEKMFELLQPIYIEMTSHKLHSENYRDFSKEFSLK